MAQKVHIELVDDIDGSTADETIRFGLDGSIYEIDLSTTNADSLRKGLDDYVKAARKVSGKAAIKVKATADKATDRATGSPIGERRMRAENRQVRDWARTNGVECPERGRIPNEVREAFEAAHA